MNFFETKVGQRFFEGQLPKLIRALTDIADALKAPRPVYQLKPEVPEDFLADLYLGNYDPSDLPVTEREKELKPEIMAVQQQLRETASEDVWSLIQHYESLLSARGAADREQAFAAGFQSATQMFAAGLAGPAGKKAA